MKELTRQENAKRAERMERLFWLDRRNEKEHSHCGTFTGLDAEIKLYKKWKDIYWRLDHHCI